MKRFKNILVFVSGPDSVVALSRAIVLAEENQAKLTVLDVLRPPSSLFGAFTGNDSAADLREDVVRQREAELATLVEQHASSGVAMETRVAVGTAHIEIIRAVLRDGHDLVMKTAEGSSLLSQRIFGSTAFNLMRQCPCPVWIVKTEHNRPFKRILAAVDVGADADADSHVELNRRILQLATSLAKLEEAELHVVYAWSMWCESMLKRRISPAQFDQMLIQQEAESDKAMAELLAQFEIPMESPGVRMIQGDPGFVIPRLVDESQIELLVLGTVGRTGIPGFVIGNTAEQVLNNADCSVLTLKPEGFESPVTLLD